MVTVDYLVTNGSNDTVETVVITLPASTLLAVGTTFSYDLMVTLTVVMVPFSSALIVPTLNADTDEHRTCVQ